MSKFLAGYSTSNQDDYTYADSAEGFGNAQTFIGNGELADSCKFRVGVSGSPTGTMVAKIYATTGTFGTDSKPTGAALATSDTIDVAIIPSGATPTREFTFYFSGVNRITLTNGTVYAVSCEYTGGDASNKISIGRDSSSPTHAGDGSSESTGSVWTARTYDNIFAIYTAPSTTPSAPGAVPRQIVVGDGLSTSEIRN